MASALLGVNDARVILKRERVDLVFSKGGFVAALYAEGGDFGAHLL